MRAAPAEDTKAVAAALNRMRAAGVDPATTLLREAVTLSLNRSDTKLQALLQHIASEMSPKISYAVQSRLRSSNTRTVDRWDPNINPQQQYSRGRGGNGGRTGRNGAGSNGGSDGSSRVGGEQQRADSWRPDMTPEEEEQQRQQRRQQRQQALPMVDDWVASGSSSSGKVASTRLGGLRAVIGGTN